MTTQYTKEKSSAILSDQVKEFLANGGAITKVKTKKAPREYRGKALRDGARIGLMGPSMRSGSNDGKSA